MELLLEMLLLLLLYVFHYVLIRGREAPPYNYVMNTCSRSSSSCLLYTSDAADEEDSVDLGGRRIIKKKRKTKCPAKSKESQTNKNNLLQPAKN